MGLLISIEKVQNQISYALSFLHQQWASWILYALKHKDPSLFDFPFSEGIKGTQNIKTFLLSMAGETFGVESEVIVSFGFLLFDILFVPNNELLPIP